MLTPLRLSELRRAALSIAIIGSLLVLGCAPAAVPQAPAAPAKPAGEAAAAKPAEVKPAGEAVAAKPAEAKPAEAAKPAAKPYYEGKTITVLVGSNPGSGVDVHARVTTQRLGAHIPGNPSIEYKNFSGDVAVPNLLANTQATKPDGLTIGAPGRSWPFYQITGAPGVEFDAWKFEQLAGFGDDDYVVYILASTGITSLEDLKTTTKNIRFLGSTTTNLANILAELLRRDLGLNVTVVSGLEGGAAAIVLVMERGEGEAHIENVSTLQRVRQEWLDKGTVRLLARLGTYRTTLPNLPQIKDLLKPESVRLLEMLRQGWGVPLVAPPGTNPEAVRILQEAFAKLSKDPEFLSEAEKRNVIADYKSPADLQNVMARLKLVTPETIALYNNVVGIR